MGENVTSSYRGLWGFLAIVGACLCVTPVALLGAGMVIAFGLLWLCSPVVEKLERETIEDARETGGGVGKFIKTVITMLFLGALAIGFSVLVMMVMLGDK